MKSLWMILLVLGLALRLIIAWLPVPILIIRTLPDDAFIYFVIARNIASGLGATFDGLSPTNGFHLLWALMLTPVFAATPRGDMPIHFALSVSALCDTAAAGLLGWVVGRRGCGFSRDPARAERESGQPRSAAVITTALYLFNPRAIQESVNGLETGLAMLALAACVAAWQWAGESPDSTWRGAVFGLLAGLAVLARSDLVVIAGVLWLAFFWTQMNADRADMKNKSASIGFHLRPVLISVAMALLVVAPWLAWSLLRVGNMAQSSAVAIPSLGAYRIQTSSDPMELWRSFLFPIINFSFRNALIYSGVSLIALCIAFILKPLTPTPPHPYTPLWLPLLGAIGIVLVHTFIRWYPRGWYFVPLAWTCALVAGPSLASASESGLGKRVAVGVGIVLAFIVTAQTVKMIAEPEYTWQSDMRAGASWLAANTQPTETVGAFNAGIYSYYSGRRVISLDGLVDWGAIKARQEKRLLDYFVERGGTLIIDHEAYAESFSPFFGSRSLELATQLPVVDTAYGPIVIYRVR